MESPLWKGENLSPLRGKLLQILRNLYKDNALGFEIRQYEAFKIGPPQGGFYNRQKRHRGGQHPHLRTQKGCQIYKPLRVGR